MSSPIAAAPIAANQLAIIEKPTPSHGFRNAVARAFHDLYESMKWLVEMAVSGAACTFVASMLPNVSTLILVPSAFAFGAFISLICAK